MLTISLINRLEKTRRCKVRGFTLNDSAKHLVNYDFIRNTIWNPEDNDTVTVRTEKKIKGKRNTCEGEGACIQIVTEPEDKKYSVLHQAAQTKR
jgi:hypothetical protein